MTLGKQEFINFEKRIGSPTTNVVGPKPSEVQPCFRHLVVLNLLVDGVHLHVLVFDFCHMFKMVIGVKPPDQKTAIDQVTLVKIKVCKDECNFCICLLLCKNPLNVNLASSYNYSSRLSPPHPHLINVIYGIITPGHNVSEMRLKNNLIKGKRNSHTTIAVRHLIVSDYWLVIKCL